MGHCETPCTVTWLRWNGTYTENGEHDLAVTDDNGRFHCSRCDEDADDCTGIAEDTPIEDMMGVGLEKG